MLLEQTHHQFINAQEFNNGDQNHYYQQAMNPNICFGMIDCKIRSKPCPCTLSDCQDQTILPHHLTLIKIYDKGRNCHQKGNNNFQNISVKQAIFCTEYHDCQEKQPHSHLDKSCVKADGDEECKIE